MAKTRRRSLSDVAAEIEATTHQPETTAPPETEESPAEEKPKRINVNVPASLHTRFKTKAASEGVTMNDLVTQWVQEYVDGRR